MKPTRKLSFLLIALCVSVLLVACAAPTPTRVAPTLAPPTVPAQATATPPAATATPAPTQTSLPPVTPTLALTSTNTSTPAPTADLSLAQVKLIGLSWLADYNFLLTFQFPGPVDPKDYRATMETKEFTCQVLPQYPNRLYCIGRSAAVQSMAWVRLYQAGSDQPGFEQYTWIPYFTVEHK